MLPLTSLMTSQTDATSRAVSLIHVTTSYTSMVTSSGVDFHHASTVYSHVNHVMGTGVKVSILSAVVKIVTTYFQINHWSHFSYVIYILTVIPNSHFNPKHLINVHCNRMSFIYQFYNCQLYDYQFVCNDCFIAVKHNVYLWLRYNQSNQTVGLFSNTARCFA